MIVVRFDEGYEKEERCSCKRFLFNSSALWRISYGRIEVSCLKHVSRHHAIFIAFGPYQFQEIYDPKIRLG